MLFGLAAALAASACGEPPDEYLEPVALDEFSEAASRAHCDWAVRCRHVPDHATCERLLEPKFYDSRRAEDAVEAGRLVFDSTAASRCLAATAAARCLARPFADPECDRMLAGLVPLGGACTAHSECEGSARCAETECDGQCCTGRCEPAPEPGPVPPLSEIGDRCETHFDCTDDAYCELDGRCAPMPEREGERCLFGCLPGDLYCDLSDLECRAYADFGEACDPERISAPPCNRAWAVCRGGVCEPRPGVGESCVADPESCIATTRCVFGLCQPRGSAGDVCEVSSECEWVCDRDEGVCVDYETCRVE